MTATTHTAPARPLPASPAADLVQTVEASVERLAEELAGGGSAELLAYLAFVARFHTYSANNQMLIYLAAPDARFVAGFQAWKKHGRRVKKGAKAIRILAPVTARRDEDGEEKRLVVGIKPVCVFPDFDTEGDDLPEADFWTLQEGGNKALFFLLVSRCPYPVSWTDSKHAHGRTDGRTITLNPRTCTTDAHKIRVLFHEWAHAVLHFGGERKVENRPTREIEADASAYILCHLCGIEATAQVGDYLTTWGGKPEALRASLTNITKAVQTIAKAAFKDVEPLPAA